MGAARVLADVLWAPAAAWRRLDRDASIPWLCVWVALLHAMLSVLQMQVAWSVLMRDGSDWVEGARQSFAATRVLGLAAVPFVIAARAGVVAAVLGLAAPSPRRHRIALAIALEAVVVVEAAAGAALAVAAQPADVGALRDLRLHAGLDLVWQPDNRWLAAVLAAANAFNVWWVVLCAGGVRHLLHAGWERALAIAVGMGVARVAWRVLWIATP